MTSRFRNVPPCKVGDRVNICVVSRVNDWSSNVEVTNVENFVFRGACVWDIQWKYEGQVYGWAWNDQCEVVQRAGVMV